MRHFVLLLDDSSRYYVKGPFYDFASADRYADTIATSRGPVVVAEQTRLANIPELVDSHDRPRMAEWQVFLRGEVIDTVFYHVIKSGQEVRQDLVEHDGYDPGITLRRVG
jgi:hypothetical protein